MEHQYISHRKVVIPNIAAKVQSGYPMERYLFNGGKNLQMALIIAISF